jgi:hypothetical protein
MIHFSRKSSHFPKIVYELRDEGPGDTGTRGPGDIRGWEMDFLFKKKSSKEGNNPNKKV